MQKSNRFLVIVLLLAAIIFVAWLFIPGASNWIGHNSTVLLTIAAIVILVFVIIRFIMEKVSTASRKTIDTILVVIAVSCLFWIYAVPVLPTWIGQNWVPIVLTITAICVIGILALKIVNWIIGRSKGKDKNGRSHIPIEIEKQVMSRAEGRCQWMYYSRRKHRWERCHDRGNLEIHHINKNHNDHSLSNLIYLDPKHHKYADNNRARSWQLREWAKGNYKY